MSIPAIMCRYKVAVPAVCRLHNTCNRWKGYACSVISELICRRFYNGCSGTIACVHGQRCFATASGADRKYRRHWETGSTGYQGYTGATGRDGRTGSSGGRGWEGPMGRTGGTGLTS